MKLDKYLTDLEEKAKGAAPLWPLTEELKEDGYDYECPTCYGEGRVDGRDYETEGAANIIAFGIGDDLGKADAFVQAANPVEVQKLIAMVREMRGALEKISHHGCCVMHSDESCPGCESHTALARLNEMVKHEKV